MGARRATVEPDVRIALRVKGQPPYPVDQRASIPPLIGGAREGRPRHSRIARIAFGAVGCGFSFRSRGYSLLRGSGDGSHGEKMRQQKIVGLRSVLEDPRRVLVVFPGEKFALIEEFPHTAASSELSVVERAPAARKPVSLEGPSAPARNCREAAGSSAGTACRVSRLHA
jgi:hypothetical protein